MASLPTRTTASFEAIQPIPSAAPLDAEFNQYVGAAGFLNGGTTATKLLLKSSDASDPPLEIDQVGAGPLAEWKQNGSLKASIDNDGDLLCNGLTGAAGVYTFGSIPVGPASNPSSDNQLARKAYVDGKKTAFSLSFGVADPSTAPVNDTIPGTITWVCPPGTSVTLTQAGVCFQSGSHTSGGGIAFRFRLRTAASSWASTSDFGDTVLNDDNDEQFDVYTSNFSDVPVVAGDTITLFIAARAGTISERDVTVALQGTQQVF